MEKGYNKFKQILIGLIKSGEFKETLESSFNPERDKK